MLTKEQRSEIRRQNWEANRRRQIRTLTTGLTLEQAKAYGRWQRACVRVGVLMTDEERFSFLSDLVEMKERRAA